ncbi:hypothetical protein Tco_0864528, partial [Tanacetum coccineum]
MSFKKRPGNDVVCYTKPLDSLKSWNDHFFWVDAFACLASFLWNSSKCASKDPFSQSSEFNAEHYATLVAYSAPFHKYPESFLCLVGIIRHYTLDENTYPEFLRDDDEEMDLLSFIRTANPTKVRIGERQCDEDEPRLLETTVGRVVPLLPVALACTSGELEASVEKLFDEGVVPMRQRKRKTDVVDASGSSHPPKKLREDHGTLCGPSVAGVILFLLYPFVTSSVSAMLEREGEDHIDSVTGLNLRAISAPQRFVISSDSSHHSGANIVKAEVDSFVKPSVLVITAATTVTLTVDPAVVVKEKIVKPSVFAADSSFAGGVDPNAGVFLDLTGSDFLVSGVRT